MSYAELMQRKLVHRMGRDTTPRCKAKGMVRVSSSGVGVTCPACIEADKPNRDAMMAEIEAAAARFRAKHCTVHASPDCENPDGPTYSGIGWDHDGDDERIECQPCSRWLSS